MFPFLPLRFLLLFFVLFMFSGMTFAQDSTRCDKLETGIFYSYPKNTGDKFVTYRDKGIAKEFNLVSKDSTYWKVDWKDKCSYTVQYVSGSAKQKPDVAEFVKKHVFFYTINAVTDEYYVYSGYVDKAKGIFLGTDTMWLHERVHVTPNRMFEQFASRQALKKARFSDTSQYALVYLYRPGKFANSLVEGHVVSFDNQPMAVMPNKVGFMFKVFQSGNHTITSRLGKDESSTQLNVELGKTYYVKAAINWVFHGVKNYQLEVKIMEPTEGKYEFAEVDY